MNTVAELFGDCLSAAPPMLRPDYIRAARELAQQGLKLRDIAEALKLTPAAVRELLAEG